MRIEFLTLKQLIFYLKTPSPLVSKLKVLYWFLIRAFLRTTIGWKRVTQLLKGVENKKNQNEDKGWCVIYQYNRTNREKEIFIL